MSSGSSERLYDSNTDGLFDVIPLGPENFMRQQICIWLLRWSSGWNFYNITIENGEFEG